MAAPPVARRAGLGDGEAVVVLDADGDRVAHGCAHLGHPRHRPRDRLARLEDQWVRAREAGAHL